ncbi:MAG: hypothetical protein WAX07_07825 [Candidatus Altiarchaeia archaeon]
MKKIIPLKEHILEGELQSFEDSRGDAALVRVKQRTLRCFFPEYSSYGWNELDNLSKLHTLEGKKINFFFKLFYLPDEIEYARKKNMEITLKQNVTYDINGIIKEAINAPSNLAVLDFGFPAYLDVADLGAMNIKEGDWIKIRARLDAYIVNK